MAQQPGPHLPDLVDALLQRPPADDQLIVLMICGMAGSGKSTLAKQVLAVRPTFTRLSIDEIIFEKHGLYGVDYPADDAVYQSYQEEAGTIYMDRFHQLLNERKDVVLDRAFYAKQDRDLFKRMAGEKGGRSVLVYLNVAKEVLWKRICARSQTERDANSALEITREVFEGYWSGFEVPDGEGEVVVDASGTPPAGMIEQR